MTGYQSRRPDCSTNKSPGRALTRLIETRVARFCLISGHVMFRRIPMEKRAFEKILFMVQWPTCWPTRTGTNSVLPIDYLSLSPVFMAGSLNAPFQSISSLLYRPEKKHNERMPSGRHFVCSGTHETLLFCIVIIIIDNELSRGERARERTRGGSLRAGMSRSRSMHALYKARNSPRVLCISVLSMRD